MRIKNKIIIVLIGIVVFAILMSGCTETNEQNNENTNNDDLNDNTNTDDDSDKNQNNNSENSDDQDQNKETQSNLLGHWKFDETSGTTASDSTGNYDATIYGDAIFSTGKKGNSLYFDGVDDYVKLPVEAISQIGNLTEGTISLWINYTSVLDSQVIMPIFYIGNEDNNDDDSLFIIEIGHFDNENPGPDMLDPDNKKLYATWVDVAIDQNPYLCFDTNENLEENTWYHFVLVVNSSGNTGYLNGEELKDRNYNFGTESDKKFLSDIPVKEICTIGYGKSHSDVSSDFMFYKGYIDDLRIYNEPLTKTEIQEMI